MKPLSSLSLLLIPVFALAGCAPVGRTVRPTELPPATIATGATPVMTLTETLSLTTHTPSPTIVPTPFDTLEPAQARETIQPLLEQPMNCAVPCFWGIIPGKTTIDEARNFFSRLGFVPLEGRFEGRDFYTIEYDSGTGHDSSASLIMGSTNLVESIEVTPDIPEPREGVPREWIAYSPETLIKRYGSPSRVAFTVGQGPNIGINMIMYFDPSNLIVRYSGYNMNPASFCPLTAPFDHVRLWIGANPPGTPSYETVPLEKATSLTVDEFASLMTGPADRACITLKEEAFP